MGSHEFVALGPFAVVELAILVAIEEGPERRTAFAALCVWASLWSLVHLATGEQLLLRRLALCVVEPAVVVAIEAADHFGWMRRARSLRPLFVQRAALLGSEHLMELLEQVGLRRAPFEGELGLSIEDLAHLGAVRRLLR